MTDFHLSDQDKAQPLWLRLKAHLEDRLAIMRARNDVVQPEDQTAANRGEIKTLKGLIALGDARPVVTGNEDQPPA